MTIGRSAALTPRPSSNRAVSASASASIHWWGRRLRTAYSRSAIDAGVNVDPTICSVSAAAESSTARRARNASSTVSLSRTSVSTRDRKTSAGTTTTSLGSATRVERYGRWRVTRLTSPRNRRAPCRVITSPSTPRISTDPLSIDDEVVVVVGRREQHVARLDLAPLTERGHDGELVSSRSGKATASGAVSVTDARYRSATRQMLSRGHGRHMHPPRHGRHGCAALERPAARTACASAARWVHLRLCMECGHVGCCDNSPNRHATAHFNATRPSHHPVVRAGRGLVVVLPRRPLVRRRRAPPSPSHP